MGQANCGSNRASRYRHFFKQAFEIESAREITIVNHC